MKRLFIDEAGDHNLKSANDPNERYLCLVGLIFDLDYAENEFAAALDKVKLEIFGTRDVGLHRRELIDKKPAPYDRLNDPAVRARFDELILQLIEEAEFTIITVLIDKQRHINKYAKWHYHPYHYCLTAMVERYVHWLEEEDAVGDVMAEAREKKQNMQLEKTYRYIYRNGTGFASASCRFIPPAQMQKRLTTGQLKLRTKKANVAALQLADLLANPARRHLLCRLQKVEMKSPFGREIVRILIQKKYRRSRWHPHRIMGYGVKLLP
jgi:hypothetical protein